MNNVMYYTILSLIIMFFIVIIFFFFMSEIYGTNSNTNKDCSQCCSSKCNISPSVQNYERQKYTALEGRPYRYSSKFSASKKNSIKKPQSSTYRIDTDSKSPSSLCAELRKGCNKYTDEASCNSGGKFEDDIGSNACSSEARKCIWNGSVCKSAPRNGGLECCDAAGFSVTDISNSRDSITTTSTSRTPSSVLQTVDTIEISPSGNTRCPSKENWMSKDQTQKGCGHVNWMALTDDKRYSIKKSSKIKKGDQIKNLVSYPERKDGSVVYIADGYRGAKAACEMSVEMVGNQKHKCVFDESRLGGKSSFKSKYGSNLPSFMSKNFSKDDSDKVYKEGPCRVDVPCT